MALVGQVILRGQAAAKNETEFSACCQGNFSRLSAGPCERGEQHSNRMGRRERILQPTAFVLDTKRPVEVWPRLPVVG